MTPERIEQERKAFEEWYINYLPPDSPIQYFSRDYTGYRTYRTRVLFEGWLARAAQSEWISVKDRLPEINTYVLAATSRGLVIIDRVCDYGRGKEWVSGHSDNPITHWQPLPLPPTANPAA